jgi:malate dehydrogenase
VFLGVPAKLGEGGIKQVIEVDLNDEEQELLDTSAEHVHSVLADFRKLMNG